MQPRWPKRAKPAAPYSKVAPFYDYLMRHVNYARWAAYVIGLFGQAEGAVRSVLDIACGTGSLLIEIAGAGYEVFGFDLSPSMVQQAQRKLQARWLVPNGLHLPEKQVSRTGHLWCGDMRCFAVRKPVDVALCLYDSINYCEGIASVAQVLMTAAAAVRRGGLLIFDICTERNCQTHFANYYEHDGTADYSYTRRAHFQPRQRQQINEFLIVNEHDHSVHLELHQQKIFRVDRVRALCDNQWWHLLGCYEGFTRRTGGENSDRVHFLLKRR